MYDTGFKEGARVTVQNVHHSTWQQLSDLEQCSGTDLSVSTREVVWLAQSAIKDGVNKWSKGNAEEIFQMAILSGF